MVVPAKKSRLRLVPLDEPSGQPEPTEHAPHHAAPSDLQLVERLRGGDESAVRILHDRVRPRVDATVRALLGRGDDDHEDMVQLTMIGLIEGIGRFRGDCSLASWASLVAARAVYKEIRRRKRARRIFFWGAEDEGICPRSLTRTLEARDLAGRVRQHVERLGADKAWTFLLHDVCGFNLQEIATITDASVAAAQKRLVRARHEVNEQLAADPELSDFVARRAEQ